MGSAGAQGKLWGVAVRDWAEVCEPWTWPLYEATFAVALFRQPDGSYRQENVFRYVIAGKPA